MQAARLQLFIFFAVVSAVATAQTPSLVLQKGHFKKINSINFSKDGRKVVTTGEDGSIKIWDAFSQRILGELDGRGASFATAFYAKNDKYIVAQYNNGVYDNYSNFNIWDNATDSLRYSFTRADIANVFHNYTELYTDKQALNSVSPNGEWAILHSPDLVKWDEKLNREKTIRQYPFDIYATGTGKLFGSINRFMNAANGPFFIGFISDSCLLVALQSRLAATKTYVTTYHIYNFINNNELATFADTSTQDKRGKIAISATGKFFLRYENESSIDVADSVKPLLYTELWSTTEHSMIWRKPIGLINAVFSGNDTAMAMYYDTLQLKEAVYNRLQANRVSYISRISLRNEKLISIIPAGEWHDTPSVFSDDGNYLAVATLDSAYIGPGIPIQPAYKIKICDEAGQIFSICSLKEKPTAMAFSRDGKYLVTGFNDGNFSVWDIAVGTSSEIAAIKNETDPLLSMHNDFATNKMFYITRNMYGMQAAQSSNKVSSLSTDSMAISNQYFFLNDKYSILNMQTFRGYGTYSSSNGKLMIINNDTPSVVKEIPYTWSNDPDSFVKSLSRDSSMRRDNSGMLTTSLHYHELQSFSVYASRPDVSQAGYGWRNGTGAPPGFVFAIVRSLHSVDTIMLFSTFADFVFNKKLNGYVYLGIGNYFMAARDVKVKPLSNNAKVAQAVLSSDGAAVLGAKPDAGAKFRLGSAVKDDPLINSVEFLYCVDLANTFKFRTPIFFNNDRVGGLSQFIVAPNGKTACILSNSFYSAADFVRVINAVNGAPLYNLHINNGSTIRGATYTKDSRHLYTWSESGVCVNWDLTTGKEIFTIVFFQDHDYAIILPDGYYYISSKTDARLLNFKLNNKLYNFSQFDLKFNRPDIVLKAIGSRDAALINDYYKAWLDRISKSGFTAEAVNKGKLAVPQLTIATDGLPAVTHEGKVNLSFSMADEQFNITRYNFFINDVPLNGINGRLLTQPARTARISQELLLCEGMNKIEVNCANENAVESHKEVVYINYVPEKPVIPRTYFIGIGINQYSAQSSFVDLSYCVKDIRDLTKAFKEKYKANLVIDTLMNDSASKENILALKEKLMHTGVDDKVIVSFSGHGMVDPQHPDDFYFVTGKTRVDNPSANGLSYAQLEELLDSIPARKKLMLLDACHSGESVGKEDASANNIPGTKRGVEGEKEKPQTAGSIEILDIVKDDGFKQSSATDIFKLMKEAFSDIRRSNGAYVLSAAQSNESAGEGGGISNGWFSSCLIEQLKQSKSMTVNDLSKNVNQCVSLKSNGNQNTDNRQELAEINWQLW